MSADQSPEIAHLEEATRRGIVVEAFLDSPVGQILNERAEQRRAEALEALVTIDPENARAVRAKQNEIRVIDGALQWLAETVTEARAALARLQQLDQGD